MASTFNQVHYVRAASQRSWFDVNWIEEISQKSLKKKKKKDSVCQHWPSSLKLWVQNIESFVLVVGLPGPVRRFEDHNVLVLNPRSNPPSQSVLHVLFVSVVIYYSWTMQGWCSGELSAKTSLQWQQTTTTFLLSPTYYHLHPESGFTAKLELLTCVILPYIDIQYGRF